MCRRSSDQNGGGPSSRSGQFNARMSRAVGQPFVTAAERRSPRRWKKQPSGSCPTGSRRRAGSAALLPRRSVASTWLNASTMAHVGRGRSMSLPPPLNDRWVGFSASAGSSCSSTMGQASLPRIARLAYSTGRRSVRPSFRDEIGPAAYAPVGEFVADALGEGVADRDETHGCHSPSLRRGSAVVERWPSDRQSPRGRPRRPRRTPRRPRRAAAPRRRQQTAPPAGRRSTRSARRPPPSRAGRAQRGRIHLRRHGVQRAPRAEVEERQRHPAAITAPSVVAVPKKRAATADPARNTESVTPPPHLDEPGRDGIAGQLGERDDEREAEGPHEVVARRHEDRRDPDEAP